MLLERKIIMGLFNHHNHNSEKTTDSPVETWQLTASGIVQGVGFRWRSEERRVGKEWRCRGAADQEKKREGGGV